MTEQQEIRFMQWWNGLETTKDFNPDWHRRLKGAVLPIKYAREIWSEAQPPEEEVKPEPVGFEEWWVKLPDSGQGPGWKIVDWLHCYKQVAYAVFEAAQANMPEPTKEEVVRRFNELVDANLVQQRLLENLNFQDVPAMFEFSLKPTEPEQEKPEYEPWTFGTFPWPWPVFDRKVAGNSKPIWNPVGKLYKEGPQIDNWTTSWASLLNDYLASFDGGKTWQPAGRRRE